MIHTNLGIAIILAANDMPDFLKLFAYNVKNVLVLHIIEVATGVCHDKIVIIIVLIDSYSQALVASAGAINH
jgi:hypothetical protein